MLGRLIPRDQEFFTLFNELATRDAIYHEAVGGLVRGSPDPLDVIRWKEIYDKLEESTDSCMAVIHSLQTISLKNA